MVAIHIIYVIFAREFLTINYKQNEKENHYIITSCCFYY